MTVGDYLDELLVSSVGFLFLYAASFKMVTSVGLRATVSQLTNSQGLAVVLARLIPPFEIVLGLAVLGFAPAAVGGVLLVIAASAMSIAGTIALRKGHPIRCSCLSSRSSAVLGWHQLAVAIPLIGAALLMFFRNPRHELDVSLVRLAIVCSIGATIHIGTTARDWTALVGYRRAGSGVYPS